MTNPERPAPSLLPEGISVRTSLFVSYLLILLLPILLSLIVFFGSYKVTSGQAEQTVAVVGQHLASLVDTYLDEARSESFALMLNDYSKKLMNYTSTSPTTRQILYLSELQKEMRFKVAASSYIETMYAVFPKSDVILSSSGVYYQHNFAYQCRADLGMSLEEWDDFLDFDGHRQLCILEGPDGSIHMLAAQKNRYTAGGKQPGMILVMNLDVTAFRSILDGLSRDGGSLAMIYDTVSGGALLSGSQPEEVSYSFQDGQPTPRGSTIMSLESVGAGTWDCALLMPMSGYLSSLAPLFISAGVYLMAAFIGGIALSSYMSNRQSSPMRELSKRMLAAVEQAPLEKNEYRQVHSALTELLRQRSNMVEQNELAQKGLREHVLRSILSGRVSKDSLIYRHAYNCGIRLDSGRFLVIVYDVEDFGKAFSGVGADGDGDDFLASVLDVVVYTVSQDPQNGAYSRYAVEIDGRIACLVCCPSGAGKEDISRDALNGADQTRSYLAGSFSLILSAAVSQVYDSVEDIRLCYKEALETLEYMETMGLTARSCLYSDISKGSGERSPALAGILERERQLCNCVKAGEYQAARELLQWIVDSMELGSCSVAEARLRMLGLVGAVEPALEEAQASLGAPGLPNPEGWLQTKDVTAIASQIDRALESFDQAASRQRVSSPSRQREQFLLYAEAHLTDPNLNVTMAAETFDMSPSYFSRLFKKSVGAGFLDHVHQNRVKLAKDLMLANPNMPLKDIAEQVGYTTPLALNRAFRKYEGVPPSVFRKQI